MEQLGLSELLDLVDLPEKLETPEYKAQVDQLEILEYKVYQEKLAQLGHSISLLLWSTNITTTIGEQSVISGLNVPPSNVSTTGKEAIATLIFSRLF